LQHSGILNKCVKEQINILFLYSQKIVRKYNRKIVSISKKEFTKITCLRWNKYLINFIFYFLLIYIIQYLHVDSTKWLR